MSASGVGLGRGGGGVVVGVVESVGSCGGEERAGVGVAVKRKRREESEELGSSGMAMPASKKRIRVTRQRVQVSASSSQAPDTQGSSMAKVGGWVWQGGSVEWYAPGSTQEL